VDKFLDLRGEEIKTKPLFVWAGGGSAARGFCQPTTALRRRILSSTCFGRERGVLALDFVDHHPSLFERDECCRALRLAAGGNIAAGAIAERRGIIAAAENTNNCHLSTLIYFHLNVQGPIKTGGKILLYGPCAPSDLSRALLLTHNLLE
jgi:hypothetical protein